MHNLAYAFPTVIPAALAFKLGGIQNFPAALLCKTRWIPACAGMTNE